MKPFNLADELKYAMTEELAEGLEEYLEDPINNNLSIALFGKMQYLTTSNLLHKLETIIYRSL